MALSIYSFYLSIHDLGEFRLKMSGCRGAEYYIEITHLLNRLDEFDALDIGMSINLLFTASNEKSGYYFPTEEQQTEWINILSKFEFFDFTFDLANTKTSQGELVVPGFYHERDNDLIGFRPVAKKYIERGVPFELERGFDVTKNNSLYN